VHRFSHKTNPTTIRFTDEDRNILNQLAEMTRMKGADVIRLAIRESLLHRKRKADARAYEEREDATKKAMRGLGTKTVLDPEPTIEDMLLPPPVPDIQPPVPESLKEKTLATCCAILPRAQRPCGLPAGEWMYEDDPLCDAHAKAYRDGGYELRRFL
jgi:predicted transcriptional regulator